MVIFLFRWRSILVRDVTNLRSVAFLLPWHGIGKCIACLTYLPTFLTPSYLALPDVLMLHLRNQQLYARENRIPRPSPIETYRCPIFRGKVWFFDFLPSFPVVVPHFSIRLPPFPRLISDHGSSFVRSVMGVPLLSGREHARERRQERNARFFFSLPSRFDFFNSSFFQSVQVFGLRAASLSMQSPLPAPSVTRARRAFRGIFLTVSSLAELIDDRSCFPVRLVERNRVESHRYKI